MPPPIPVGLPASLLERRPDVMQAEQQLVASNADIGVAKSLFFPTISLTGFLGGISGDLTKFLGGDGAVWSLGGSVLQPIFQGGRLRRNLEAARARFDGALAEYQKSALNSYREVANALLTIQKLAEVRVQRQASVTNLQDASDLARSRYDSGLANYLEILTADEQLFDDQLLLAQTRGAELRARAELYRTLGGGWQPVTARQTRCRNSKSQEMTRRKLLRLQAKLCVLQDWVKAKGLRVIVIFEGRDAAGKGGTIKAITERGQPARVPARGAAGPFRPREEPDVPAALHASLSRGRRDRHLRPELVQPRRRRARDGLLHRRTVRAIPPPGAALRKDHHRRRHPAGEVLARGRQQGAGAALPRPDAPIRCASGS